jgi:hypothetical protein
MGEEDYGNPRRRNHAAADPVTEMLARSIWAEIKPLTTDVR